MNSAIEQPGQRFQQESKELADLILKNEHGSETRFIVVTHGYALKLHTNHCGHWYAQVSVPDATRFETEAAAHFAAGKHNLRHYTVERREFLIESGHHHPPLPADKSAREVRA